MTKPFIEDCFIGNYPVTQEFGENPKNYAQFGMKNPAWLLLLLLALVF